MNTTHFVILTCIAAALFGCSRKEVVREIEAQVIKVAAQRADKWEAAQAAAKNPPAPFRANFEFVTSPKFDGKTLNETLAALPKDYPHSFVFVADDQTLDTLGFPFLCIDLLDERRPTFRVDAKHAASVANNLSLANMDFGEFLESSKKHGVFRGF